MAPGAGSRAAVSAMDFAVRRASSGLGQPQVALADARDVPERPVQQRQRRAVVAGGQLVERTIEIHPQHGIGARHAVAHRVADLRGESALGVLGLLLDHAAARDQQHAGDNGERASPHGSGTGPSGSRS
jgi:hypothetical protein